LSTPRTPPAGILPGGAGGNNDDDIFDRFDAAQPAGDFGPLPPGVYVALATGGELTEARTGTKGYRVTFRVVEGEYAGRRLWLEKYFTPAAMPYTKRDLGKLGIDSRAKLARPFPANRMVCRLTVTRRRSDGGAGWNEIRRLEVIRFEQPAAAPPGPPDDEGDGIGDRDYADDGDTSFPFGANGGPRP
jgi:hypothetical protein